jgi:hypothetical protein
MKKVALFLLTIMAMHNNAARDHYYFNNHCCHYDTYCTYKPIPEVREFRNPKKSAHSRTLILASLYGALSGYLCRQFEREVLRDVGLFRIVNLIIWGNVQQNLLQAFMDDLKEQNVGYSAETTKYSAWLISWISYLMA